MNKYNGVYTINNSQTIFCENGRITTMSTRDSSEPYLKRGMVDSKRFLNYAESLITRLLGQSTSDFMNLYLKLIDDEECRKICEKLYHDYIYMSNDSEYYPYETLKKLRDEELRIDKDASYRYPYSENNDYYFEINNGIIVLTCSGGHIIMRNHSDFIRSVIFDLHSLVDYDPESFMTLYRKIMNKDEVCIELAEDIRQGKINRLTKIFKI